MYLSANYKVFENDETSPVGASKVLFQSGARPIGDDDPFPSLVFGGDTYNAFVQHVDCVFRQVVVDCYGCFVSLTVPIVS